ncbi:hypothetical protein SAMN05216310_11413 [Nitrosomonas europaea]|nr:hypothetical protein SAMN05216310_11413 [Nitrosomonas europaea]
MVGSGNAVPRVKLPTRTAEIQLVSIAVNIFDVDP